MTNPSPTSGYDPSSGGSFEITNESTTTVNNSPSQSFSFQQIAATNTGFQALSTIPTYENKLEVWFEGKNSNDSTFIDGTRQYNTIYVNVRPHITSYYFEKSDGSQVTNQVQGSNSEAVNLVVKAKDYNGCPNIDGGTVTANLSSLGLSSSEALTYICPS